MAKTQNRRTGKRGAAASRKGGSAGAHFRLRPLSELEQRHLDLIGLGFLAASLYLGLILYGGWAGGSVGEALAEGFRWAAGAVAYAIPMLLAGIGMALVMRPFVRSPGSLNAGTILLVAGLLLIFAAGTAGAGPDRPIRADFFNPDFMRAHGGALGEALYWASSTLFQRAGAHIIGPLMAISGALLLTGRPIASLLTASIERGQQASRITTELARSARTRISARRDEEQFSTLQLSETGGFAPVEFEQLDETAVFSEAEMDALGDERGHDADPESAAVPGAIELDVVGDPEDDTLPPEPEVGIEIKRTPMGSKRSGITESDEIDYKLPPQTLLRRGSASDKGPDRKDLEATARALLEALGHFGIAAKIVGTVVGPHVSRFELQLAPGTKVGKISQLKDDLAYALASTDIRILAPIPGKRAVGVEVPNADRKMVRLGDIYAGRPKGASPLVAWLGKDISGQAIWSDFAKMPHVLVAGTTGSGKSGCVNAILSSMLLHSSPNELRLVLVDPKQVELNHYDSVPHLLTPVVTSPRVAANVLSNLIAEMENRYSVMGKARARNLEELNRHRRAAGEATLPHILCVIDEFADLMMVAPAEVEDSIIRLAQKSRAVGIHLVLATQRPSTDVITGTIKVNIPARIAFAVASQVDSRVILDQGGAESLLGQGDMLFRPVGTSKLQRVQGAFIAEDEIAKIVSCWNRQGTPDFSQDLLEAPPEADPDPNSGDFPPDEDDLLEQAVRICVETDTASVSMIQRRLRVGYTRAGRLIDMLERRGVISGYEGSKPRQVLISAADIPRILGPASAAADGSQLEDADGPPSGEAEREPARH